MDLVFLGTGDFAVPALLALRAAGHRVRRVLSQPDRPAGRGRAVLPTPVRAAAAAAGLAHVQCEDVNASQWVDAFADAELGIVVAFGQKLGPEVLSALPRGLVNIHGSLLPKYRGAAPYQWAVINGEAESGVTTFQLNERWDAGAIWGQKRTPIGPTETADELHDRLALLGAELIVETVADIAAGRRAAEAQDAGAATRAPKLKKSDGYLDWARPARELVNWINGLWSWPTATADYVARSGRAERVQLGRAALVDEDAAPGGGSGPGAFHGDGTLQTGRGRLQILQIKPAGKPLMDFAAFARGRQLGPGDRLQQVVTP